MKKYLTTTAIALIALFTVTSTFAARNTNAKKSIAYSIERFTTADNGTIVSDGNTTTAYNENGDWVYTIERCTADSLPLDVFKTIRGAYGNCYITGMEKIKVPGYDAIILLVHIQDETTYKTVRISNDNIETTQELNKL